jgi:hypothetical protein
VYPPALCQDVSRILGTIAERKGCFATGMKVDRQIYLGNSNQNRLGFLRVIPCRFLDNRLYSGNQEPRFYHGPKTNMFFAQKGHRTTIPLPLILRLGC